MAENALAPSGPTGRPAHPHPVFAVTKLLEQILSNLNVREIVRAQKVCKLWLECFNGSLKLKQQCFLAAVPETEGNRLVECIENPEILRDTDPAIGRHLVKHTHTAADTPFLAHDGVLGVFFRTFEKPSLTFETAREMFRSRRMDIDLYIQCLRCISQVLGGQEMDSFSIRHLFPLEKILAGAYSA